MPHLSKKKLSGVARNQLEKHLLTLIKDTVSQTRLRILDELLTPTEKVMLAKRIGILFLLRKGVSGYKIYTALGVSPSTVERFERGMETRKYPHTLQWVRRKTDEGKIEELLEKIARLIFTGRTVSF